MFIDPLAKISAAIKDSEGKITGPDLMKQTQKKAATKTRNKKPEKATKASLEYDLTDDGKGKKYDSGKPMPGTLVNVFPEALLAIGMCIEFGTHKYPNPNNWKQVEGASKRYQDSLMRHLIKHNLGETKDRETGLPHLAHTAWNALAILQLYLMDHPEIVEEYLK